jgi:hypothetical protein
MASNVGKCLCLISWIGLTANAETLVETGLSGQHLVQGSHFDSIAAEQLEKGILGADGPFNPAKAHFRVQAAQLTAWKLGWEWTIDKCWRKTF